MKNKIIWGMLLLVVSIVLILNVSGAIVLQEGTNLWSFWPIILIGLGLSWLFDKGRSKRFPLLLTLFGAYLIYLNLGYTGLDKKYILPVLLLVFAIYIIASAIKKSKVIAVIESKGTYSNFFSSGKIDYNSEVFTSCDLSAVFGGTELDLTSTTINLDGAYISASVAFGGIKIIVSEGTNVINKGFVIFGGVDHKHQKKGPGSTEFVQNGTLTVDVSGAFGGVEIHYI